MRAPLEIPPPWATTCASPFSIVFVLSFINLIGFSYATWWWCLVPMVVLLR